MIKNSRFSHCFHPLIPNGYMTTDNFCLFFANELKKFLDNEFANSNNLILTAIRIYQKKIWLTHKLIKKMKKNQLLLLLMSPVPWGPSPPSLNHRPRHQTFRN